MWKATQSLEESDELDSSFFSKQMTQKMLVSSFAGFILMTIVLYSIRIAFDLRLVLVLLFMSAASIIYLLISRGIYSRDGDNQQGLLAFFGTSDLYLTLMLFCSLLSVFYSIDPFGRSFSFTAISSLVLSIVSIQRTFLMLHIFSPIYHN